MRNFKKLLALVLAMVMAFSLMLSAGAVDYKDYADKDQITEEFKEAVQVLTGLKVFQGDERGFAPADTITRAEVAAIVYRIATGDVTDSQMKIYADYSNFTDVSKDDWFAGYVGYCQNAGYIKGTSPTTFQPYGKVTGYEALAMILRVVGYDKNHEFEGASWQVNVASLSKELSITDNVKNANFETTLNMAARRDVVADLLFQTAAWVPTVTYTPALAYNDKTTTIGSEFNATLGQKTFGLWKAVPGGTIGTMTIPGENAIVDMWGRPGYWWVKNGTKQGVDKDTNKPLYYGTLGTDTDNDPYTYPRIVATIFETPALTYTSQIKECDLAHDYNIATQKDFSLYVNSNTAVTNNYRVVATDTVTPVGGQGRLTEVYKSSSSHRDDRVVMIDTYLAKVTNVTDAVLDAAGHVIVPAKLDLRVYDGVNGTDGTYAAAGSSAANTGTAKIISKPANSAENWEYSKGDMILLNAYTLKQFPMNPTANSKVHGDYYPTGGPLAAATEDMKNKAAYEDNAVYASTTNQVTGEWTSYNNGHSLSVNNNVQVLGKAESKITKQGTVYYNQNKHSVGGTDTPDAMLLYKDEAGVNTTRDWAWYFDQYGNVIGIDAITETQFGVITDLWAAFGQGETNTDGTEKIMAKVKLADGSETTMEISKFLVTTAGAPSATSVGDGKKPAETTPAIVNNGNVLDLTPVYDYAVNNSVIMRALGVRSVSSPVYGGYSYLHVAPVSSLNKTHDTNNYANDDTYGIILDNLFKFTANENGSFTAVEVAGNGNSGGATGFGSLYNILADGTTDATHNRLFKNLGYITVDNTGNQQAAVWVDNDTKIMIYNPAGGTVTCYDGVSELPGNVAITATAVNAYSEVDWADTDGDGRAEYVYFSGIVENSVSYGLFYYDGGNAQWNNANKSGTITGYLNGEAQAVNFLGDGGKALFDRLLSNANGYNGRLFALQLSDGVVTSLMEKTAGNAKLVDVAGVPVTGISTNVKTTPYGGGYPGALPFVTGTSGGNYYTNATEAVWFNDNNINGTNNGDFEVTYNRTTRQVIVNGKDGNGTTITSRIYTVTDNTKIIGNLDYLDPNSSIAWLSDVTIVYEPTGIYAIDEIYITTQPTVTPGNPTVDRALTLNSIRVDSGSNIEFYVTCASTETTGFTANNVTLKNTTTGADVLVNTSGTVTAISAGSYKITVANPGGIGNNAAGYLYEGKLSLTITESGVDVTYTCDFSNRGIL